MKRYLLTICAIAISLTTLGARADMGIKAHAGTLGKGLELSKGFGEDTNVSLAFNTFTYDVLKEDSGVDYDYSLELKNVALLLNWHPFDGVFRLSSGLVYNRNSVDMLGRPGSSGTFTINDRIYSASDVGTMTGDISFNRWAPYVGFGWGNRPRTTWGLGMTFDIGAMYQGTPKINLAATGAASNQALADDLNAERDQVQEELEALKWWPVIAIGAYVRF